MSEKAKSIIAYVFGWIGGLIILYVPKNNSKNTNLHAAQSIVIRVASIVISVFLSFIPFIGGILSFILAVLSLVVWIVGIIKVISDSNPEIPIIYEITKVIFSNKLEK